MAVVFDRNDPNGQGMFSKAGRVTSAKYGVFQRKAEIMNNQRKFLKVTSVPFLLQDLVSKSAPIKPLQEEEQQQKLKMTLAPEKRPQTAPFSQQISRDEVDRVKGIRNPPPPTGFYNPKFFLTERKPPVLFKYEKEKARPKSSSRSFAKFDEEESSKPLPNRQRRKVVGPIPLEMQTAREQFYRNTNDPHEDRFLFKDFPPSFSKTRRVPSVNLRKSCGRNLDSAQSLRRSQPDYNPNFEVGKRQLSSSGPAFNKLSGRRSVENISYSINDGFFNVDRSLILKFPKTKDIDFSRDIPRDWDPKYPLPCFMQKGNNSRLSCGQTSQKALEVNNYSEGKFQSVISDFSPKSYSRSNSKKSVWKI